VLPSVLTTQNEVSPSKYPKELKQMISSRFPTKVLEKNESWVQEGICISNQKSSSQKNSAKKKRNCGNSYKKKQSNYSIISRHTFIYQHMKICIPVKVVHILLIPK